MKANPSSSPDPIQVLWIRGELSRMELLSIRSFLANGHPVHFYTYECPANVPDGATIFEASGIVPANLVPQIAATPFGAGSYGSFSDFFRYCLLDARGGWWSDLDLVCLRPWVFQAEALTASTFEKGHGRIANGCVMRFPAAHPVIRHCRGCCEKMDLRKVDISHTGPLLLHQTLKELDFFSLCEAPEVFCPVPWNASWQLVRPLWMRFTLDELKQRLARPHLSCHFTRRTVAIHLWNETWRNAERDKHAVYPQNCIYEKAQRRWNP